MNDVAEFEQLPNNQGPTQEKDKYMKVKPEYMYNDNLVRHQCRDIAQAC